MCRPGPKQYGYGEPEIDEDGSPYVHKYFEAVPEGHSARLRTLTKVDQKKAVIEQNMGSLTNEEIAKHSEEVSAAMYEELRILGRTSVF